MSINEKAKLSNEKIRVESPDFFFSKLFLGLIFNREMKTRHLQFSRISFLFFFFKMK